MFKKLQRIESVPISKREKTGINIPIAIPALTASSGSIEQYDIDSSALKPLRNFPSANKMTITNTSSKILAVRLGFSDKSKYTIPANVIYTINDVDYQGFDIQNLGAADTTATEVIVNVVYEHPLKVRQGE